MKTIFPIMRASKFKIIHGAEIYPYILKKNKKKKEKKNIDVVIIKKKEKRFSKTKMSQEKRIKKRNKKFKKNIKKYGFKLNTQINIGIYNDTYICAVRRIDYETNLIMLQYPGGYTAEYTMKSIKRMNVMAIYLTQKSLVKQDRLWLSIKNTMWFTPTQMTEHMHYHRQKPNNILNHLH